MLTQEYLKTALEYNPETGVFLWKVRPLNHFDNENGMRAFNSRLPGRVAGSIDTHGYIQIKINNILYLAHRLAWLYVYNEWPEFDIDHANRNRSDNRISNLRNGDGSLNNYNTKMYKNNSTGLKGVSKHKNNNRWQSNIGLNGKQVYLGIFDCPAAASFAYQIAADINFGGYCGKYASRR